jgi:CheY-like chemotaxis protein
MMPEMDGFEFLDALAAREEWREIPVIVITARPLTAGERERLLRQARKVLEKATGFNRPDRLDALLTPIVEGLLEALPRLARDAAVGVIVPAWVAARVAYDGCSPSVVRAT